MLFVDSQYGLELFYKVQNQADGLLVVFSSFDFWLNCIYVMFVDIYIF